MGVYNVRIIHIHETLITMSVLQITLCSPDLIMQAPPSNDLLNYNIMFFLILCCNIYGTMSCRQQINEAEPDRTTMQKIPSLID